MLSPYRVLDLTDHRGQSAGSILAALGADVVLIEPRTGSPGRTHGPFSGTTSLTWWAYNRGKRSAVVDLASAEFQKLLAGADIVLDSGPATADAPALDRTTIAATYPALIHVTVSPFGIDGPKADWPASDLTVLASACQLALTGDSDRAPLRTSVPQAWLHAGAEAAAAAVLALLERARSGRGQHVDVSAQTATMMAAVPATIFGVNGAPDPQRIAGGLRIGRLALRFVYPAQDGFVSIMHNFSNASGPYTARLMEFAYENGYCDTAMRDTDWIGYVGHLHTGAIPLSHFEEAKLAVAALTASKPKAELFAEAQKRPLLLAPVADLADLLASEQLAARDYFEEVEDPGLGSVRAPGAFARLSASPLRPLGRAPLLGEHTEQLLAEPARRPMVPGRPPGVATPPELPLAGLKVVDFTWVYAGPLTTRQLVDFGATVIKVESGRRPDSTRGAGPFLDREPGSDSSAQFSHFNAGKLGLSLDLGTPQAREVVADLARWADVVIDSFTPGVLAGWGYSHDRLLELNPRLIALSTCLMGQSGPLASFAGFGNLAGAISGFYELTGWPDRAPAGPFLAYTDYIAPRYLLAVLLAALDWRSRSGVGQSIDLSQAECSIHFLAPALLDWQLNGESWAGRGNTDCSFAPHGVYPTTGTDQWLAIVCENDKQWRALAHLVGHDGLAELDLKARFDRAEEIDEILVSWTSPQEGTDATSQLIGAGVPAHPVHNSRALAADPQLVHRGHFQTIHHHIHGSVVVEGPRAGFSRTPGRPTRSGPSLGEHAHHVLSDLLGYSDDQITELVIAGALE